MKKLFYLLLFLFSFINISAQFDTEHWFAPMSEASQGISPAQYLYLSTNEKVPFQVKIYNNNILIANINNLSKGNPQKFFIPRNYIITSNSVGTNSKTNMGLHLIGDKKFFANIRFSITSHAEIITSKGKSALGKDYFIGMGEQYIPNTLNNLNALNSMVGVIATEDNTNIKLSGYDTGLVFSDGTIDDEKNIILNKGESYIFEAKTSNVNTANNAGLIGAHLTSDKPISVTNGNFLSLSENKTNFDILMDQSVPIERIGTEYVVLKGNGSATGANFGSQIGFMEKVLVIATENNTQVYVNDETTPIATLNKGQSYIIKNKFYNPTGDIFNLYIKATKSIYVYQFLAGTKGDSNTPEFATGGFNFIPSLSCYLPNSIDEIGMVNEIPYGNGFDYYSNTKLNIITEKGAKVFINDLALNASNGPFPLKGNNDWETYVLPNINGNLTLKSTKAITAGIAAGNGAVGFGGYFAGFNSVPVISKGGDCENNNLTLEVDNTYDSYQWYKNGIPYTGADAQTYIITPDGPGYYFVKIIKNGCGAQDSPIYKLMPCTTKSNKTYNIGSCNNILNISPTFSKVSQPVIASSVKITSTPSNGTATINSSTGEIIYTLTNPTATTDTFSYTFSGTDPDFPETEIVTVTININHFTPFNAETFSCSNIHSEGTFDLTHVDYSSLNLTAAPEYYLNYDEATGAFSNKITSGLTSYYSGLKTIYVKLIDQYGCVGVSKLSLKFYPIPNLNTITFNSTLCDLDFDGNYSVTFSKDVSPIVVNGYQDFNISYYLNSSFTGTPLPDNWSYNTPTRVYVLVDSKNGCTNKTGYIDFKIGTKIIVNNYSTSVCDNDLDGKIDVNLEDYSSFIRNSSGAVIRYFTTQADANNNTNAIKNLNQTISQTTTYYVRIEDPAAGCPNWSILMVNFSQPLTSSLLKDRVICPNSTTTMDAGTGFTAYKWSNGATTQTSNYGLGNHYVDLSFNGCVYRQYFKITESEEPIINSIIVAGNNIVVNVSGGNPPYYYSLDGINYQTSNEFINLQRGIHKIYVQAAERCIPIEKEFLIINLLNAITPNGDGINDILDYSDLKIKKEVKILIVDRYGNTILKEENSENYYWTGKQNGRSLPSGTYWYVLEWTEPDTGIKINYKGWVLLKNRN